MQNLINKIDENLHIKKRERKDSELSTDSQVQAQEHKSIIIFFKLKLKYRQSLWNRISKSI